MFWMELQPGCHRFNMSVNTSPYQVKCFFLYNLLCPISPEYPFSSGQFCWFKSFPNMSHSTWYLSLRWQDFLTELKPYFSFNESTLLLFKLSIQTLATSPNRYAAGMPGSTANSSYLVKGIRPALSFSQECGMAELLTKSDKLDIHSLCSRVMPQVSVVFL